MPSHVWCFGPSATFGDRAGFMVEGDYKEKVSVLLNLKNEEVRLQHELGMTCFRSNGENEQ